MAIKCAKCDAPLSTGQYRMIPLGSKEVFEDWLQRLDLTTSDLDRKFPGTTFKYFVCSRHFHHFQSHDHTQRPFQHERPPPPPPPALPPLPAPSPPPTDPRDDEIARLRDLLAAARRQNDILAEEVQQSRLQNQQLADQVARLKDDVVARGAALEASRDDAMRLYEDDLQARADIVHLQARVQELENLPFYPKLSWDLVRKYPQMVRVYTSFASAEAFEVFYDQFLGMAEVEA
ncbi:hypothetical protein GGF32_003267, partial [Allomyces javanicus]